MSCHNLLNCLYTKLWQRLIHDVSPVNWSKLQSQHRPPFCSYMWRTDMACAQEQNTLTALIARLLAQINSRHKLLTSLPVPLLLPPLPMLLPPLPLLLCCYVPPLPLLLCCYLHYSCCSAATYLHYPCCSAATSTTPAALLLPPLPLLQAINRTAGEMMVE